MTIQPIVDQVQVGRTNSKPVVCRLACRSVSSGSQRIWISMGWRLFDFIFDLHNDLWLCKGHPMEASKCYCFNFRQKLWLFVGRSIGWMAWNGSWEIIGSDGGPEIQSWNFPSHYAAVAAVSVTGTLLLCCVVPPFRNDLVKSREIIYSRWLGDEEEESKALSLSLPPLVSSH